MAKNRLSARPKTTGALAPAASRASWTGTLKIADAAVPVKAFAAIASSSATQLHQVHQGCGRRISYRKTCPQHGPVNADQIGKAYEYSNDCLVGLSDDELAQLHPPDDKTITLERFFPGDQLDLTLLAGRSLFLSPANPAAWPAFLLVQAALMQKRTWALGQTVFSQRRQLVVVYPSQGTLLLHTLHDPGTRRAPVSINANGSSPSRRDLRALTKVIDTASGPFDFAEYRDHSDERLASLIQRKIDGKANGRAKKTPARRKANGRSQSRPRKAAKAA